MNASSTIAAPRGAEANEVVGGPGLSLAATARGGRPGYGPAFS